jgi:Collagen triple helix repeat (20 copies)
MGEKKMATRRTTIAIATILITITSTELSLGAGRSTTPVVNTILNGKGAPKSSIGVDGDFYIDTRSLLIYGPKKKGKWPTPQNLQGPIGPSGNDGKNGNDGKTITSSVSTGSQVTGPVGPRGPEGAPGAAGPAGPQGLPGEKGDAGSAGANGSPGPAGSPGANGSQGPQGATGATGATGSQGPAGPSEVTVVDIPSWILSSAVPFSYNNSSTFGTLLAHHSYSIGIHVSGISAASNLVLGLDLISFGSTVSFSYSRNDFRFSTYSTTQNKYGFDVVGTVNVGESDSGISVRIIEAMGDSNAAPLTLTGKAYITLVGSIR